MPTSSRGKKVARASKAGKRRASPQSRSLLFPVSMGLVIVLGIALIAASRDTGSANATPPRINLDHWHAAFGVWDCDHFLQPPADRPDVTLHNLHTHGDGLIHIHPVSNAASGNRAKMSVFFDTVGYDVSEDSFDAEDVERSNGDECDSDEGIVQLAVWSPTGTTETGQAAGWPEKPTIVEGDPADYHPQDNDLVVLAFAPAGADIPQPPSISALAQPADEPTPTVPPTLPVSTTTAGESTTTTAEGTTTTEGG